MISLETKQKWTFRIEYCIKHRNKLNEWEKELINSLFNRWCYCNMDLTIRQSFKLSDIFYTLEADDI